MKIFKNGINMKWLLLSIVIVVGIGVAIAPTNPIISTTNSYFDVVYANYFRGDISNATGVLPSASIPASALNLSSPVGMVKAYNSTPQLNLPNGVATLIKLDTEKWDLNNEFAANTFTAKEQGYYRVSFSGNWYNTISGKQYLVAAYVNGADTNGIRAGAPAGTDDGLIVSASDEVHLDVGDTVALYGTSNDGAGTSDVDGGGAYLTHLTVVFNRRG